MLRPVAALLLLLPAPLLAAAAASPTATATLHHHGTRARPAVLLHDPRVTRPSLAVGESLTYSSAAAAAAAIPALALPALALLETNSAPDPQRLAPHRIECDCKFKKANPLGRPLSAYHEGVIGSVAAIAEESPPTAQKLDNIQAAQDTRNPASKVEDSLADEVASQLKDVVGW